MVEQLLTEGAERSLRLAAKLAENLGDRQAEPMHLLWALMSDESRAAEMLAEHGVTLQAVEESLGAGASPAADTLQTGTEPGNLPAPSKSLQRVLEEASRHVRLLGRQVQVGTEHLLLGLAAVASPASRLLNERGLSAETLRARLSESSGVSHEPLPVDVRIELESREQSGESREPGRVAPVRLDTSRLFNQADTHRILDAAANRAREGLRVVEDFVRFVLDDNHLSLLLKECRHELAGVLTMLDAPAFIPSRDTEQDVGTELSTPSERVRRSPLDVAEANFKRLQEAVRTLEEFGKVISPSAGESLGQLRYRLYTLEKAVITTHRSRGRLEGRCLYLLVTESLCHHGSGPAIRESLAAGVDMVQVREKSMPDRGLIEHARRVRRWTRDAGALLIMNDRPDLAVLTDADGLHVGQEELTVREARRIVGSDRVVGVSTHTIEQARQAVIDGADYIGVGPVFPSATKEFDTPAGLEFVRQVAAEIRLPWFAIGGITPENVGEVVAAGAARVAVSGAVCGEKDPASAARALRAALARAV